MYFDCLLVAFLISGILPTKKSLCMQLQIRKLKDAYRFKVFLRFLLQSFLELSCNSVIWIYFSSLSNHLQIIDFFLCILIAVIYTQIIQVAFILLIFYLIHKRSTISILETESFLKKFGTILKNLVQMIPVHGNSIDYFC